MFEDDLNIDETPEAETIGCIQVDLKADGSLAFSFASFDRMNLQDFTKVLQQALDTANQIGAALSS